MSNKKDKERWQHIQENKKKCCINCSQLKKINTGQPICYYEIKGETKYCGHILQINELNKPHKCFDKYNGKNI